MKQKSVKWWRYFFLLCLMGISVCMYASGGKRTLNGLVTDVEGVPVIGAIYRDDRMHSPERHLGLTPITDYWCDF